MNDDDELLTAEQVAIMLKVSAATVKRWTNSGDLDAERLGHRTLRYRRADVEAFLRRRRQREQ